MEYASLYVFLVPTIIIVAKINCCCEFLFQDKVPFVIFSQDYCHKLNVMLWIVLPGTGCKVTYNITALYN